jgi:predicted nuclease of restriction endonuclease-like (RecB) superfamily
MKMIDLTPLFNALVAVSMAAITAYIIPWIKSRTTAEQQETANTWVKIAVQAAEQLYKGSGKGAIKKQYVLDYLESKGFTLDATSIDNMIEAAVLELNKGVL